MTSSTEAIELFLTRLGLYGPVKKIYRAMCGVEGNRRRSHLKLFYSQFISNGDLVFDVGANTGTYTEVFASLGAAVISVEPNPECARQIRRSCADANVVVVEAAVGSSEGHGKLQISPQSVLSSMSTEWIAVARKSERFQGVSWNREIDVPILTIDSLTKHYGHPKFIKLDVEGYEEQALMGMLTQPEVLSFEFNTEYLSSAFRCINSQHISRASKFNYAIGEPCRLELGSWLNSEEITNSLSKLHDSKLFGDVLVYRP